MTEKERKDLEKKLENDMKEHRAVYLPDLYRLGVDWCEQDGKNHSYSIGCELNITDKGKKMFIELIVSSKPPSSNPYLHYTSDND